MFFYEEPKINKTAEKHGIFSFKESRFAKLL